MRISIVNWNEGTIKLLSALLSVYFKINEYVLRARIQ